MKRRKEIAQRRAKLGFNDNGATEMDDEVIDKIEYLKHLNNLKVIEGQKDRTIRAPTEVQGISAQDQLFNSLKDGEQFK